MLEVKHLRKEYRTKNGVITKALDDVSLTFAETGMVFILGKSGSGKSTLLNVCGGLDRADSGEIIIKGKSSNEFSGQDFDSYRNTYVGFVFQEYNILEEFTVEENIALALELQNKKRDKAVIDKILADVDMTSFASRKPNTLSGGQKQRVAIARALVKEPEIIMADEPTGALDSKTGQQVFDTLKKLSETKLVIVISHDRDFAEQYGDRIIELKDGKVISDQTRAESGDGAKNVRFFGTDTVCVTRGAELTDADMQSIRQFLNKAGGAAVISTSRERISEMKQDQPELSVGAFEDVKAQPQSKSYPQQKLIRSHLPARHAIRMGGSSLKTKPVRLVFTIFLSVIAFILFGLASTLMLFDGKSVTKETLNNAPDEQIILSKAYWETTKVYDGDKLDHEYENKQDTKYTYDEFTAIRNKYPGALAAVDANVYLNDISMPSNVQQFYTTDLDGFVINDDSFEYTAGKAPSAVDEIAVSDFILNGLMAEKTEVRLYSENSDEPLIVSVKKASDLIYSADNLVRMMFGGGYFKIVGVYKGMAVPQEYAELKDAADKCLQFSGDYALTWQWQQARRNGMYARVAVTNEFVDEFVKSDSGNNDNIDVYKYFDSSYSDVQFGFKNSNGEFDYRYSSNNFSKYAEKDGLKPIDVFDSDGNAVTALPANSIAVNYTVWAGLMSDSMNRAVYEGEGPAREIYENWRNEAEKAAQKEFEKLYPEPSMDDGNAWYEWDSRRNEYMWQTVDAQDPISALRRVSYRDITDMKTIKSVIKSSSEFAASIGVSATCDIYSNTNGEERSVKLAGMMFIGYNDFCAYFSDELYDLYFVKSSYDWHQEYSTNYVVPEGAYISKIFVPKSSSAVDEIVDLTYERGKDDSTVAIKNSVTEQLEMLIDLADTMELGFLIAGLVLALFAFLLMFNFISASISAKKKEIGILRAIGARTLDVFKIFLSEAMIIALICFIISTAGAFGACVLLNTALITDTFIKVSIFVFGPLSVLCILGIALVTALISTVIPVGLYSRKPPVASIRAL